MKRNPFPYIFLALAALACSLPGSLAPLAVSPQGNILTQAVQTLQAQSPTPLPSMSVQEALTLAVGSLQAQASQTGASLPSETATKPPPVTEVPRSPTPTYTPPPSQTPTVPTPTKTLGVIHVAPPITKITLIAKFPSNPKLDYTANANYGEANLSVGFSPDPYSVGMTTGGDVDVSYLGGSCSGFATSAPDLRVNFGGGGASLLRIYFVGSNGDPSMVVNDPYGNYYCVDDSFGTVNPTIDFNNPAGGTYDVWIGSYASSAKITGALYLTENSGNHP